MRQLKPKEATLDALSAVLGINAQEQFRQQARLIPSRNVNLIQRRDIDRTGDKKQEKGGGVTERNSLPIGMSHWTQRIASSSTRKEAGNDNGLS